LQKNNLKISVALCTFNGARYILEQLASIGSQSRMPDEIIVCDDASTDTTVDLVTDFIATLGVDVKLHVNCKNIGYAKNFEKALSLCTGDLVFFSDQDDRWHENKVEVIVSILNDHPSLLVITHDGYIVDSDLKWHGTKKNQQIQRAYGSGARAFTGCLSCVRREAIQFLLPFPVGVAGHDIWIDYVFSHLLNFWHVDAACLQDIRRHESNTSEWMVNSFTKVSRFKLLGAISKTSVAKSYVDRKSVNIALSERLEVVSCVLGYRSNDEIERIRDDLRKELISIEKRQKIAETEALHRRIFLSIQLFRETRYRHFNGIWSFFRDLFR
jgi:glycosyltransferase involved in cell wall biosynthesis